LKTFGRYGGDDLLSAQIDIDEPLAAEIGDAAHLDGHTGHARQFGVVGPDADLHTLAFWRVRVDCAQLKLHAVDEGARA
jgi:hypothetical protein